MRERTVEENRKLIEKMPFLLPVNRFSGKIVEDYDYSYTELDVAEIPKGWDELFYNYCCEITPIIDKVDALNDFHFLQVKEKWGELRIYNCGVNPEILREMRTIEKKYVDMSAKTCCICGKPGKMTYIGWISPFCKECWETKSRGKIPYEDAIRNEFD